MSTRLQYNKQKSHNIPIISEYTEAPGRFVYVD